MEDLKNCPLCGGKKFSLFLKVTDSFLSQEEFSILQCDFCELKFVNPRPTREEIGNYYLSDDYISHDSDKKDLLSNVYRLARKFAIRKKYGIIKKENSPKRLLDIGCGTGEFLKYCQEQGLDVFGYEPNIKARCHAILKNKLDIKESLTDFKSMAGSFQCVTMWHVLEHVHDLTETLESVKKLLTPEGLLVIAVPNCNSWDARYYKQFWAAYDVPRHLFHFTEQSMKQLAQKSNFEISQILPQKLDSYYVSMLSEKYCTGRSNYFNAFLRGLTSNFEAKNPNFRHSSLIYLLRQKIA
ncbi:MAG: class I SAM-dependent methyltransferase [Bacteroidales bacterium]|nr:class I SAM-dependent methyltransferase [Bacteroidales bacterium]